MAITIIDRPDGVLNSLDRLGWQVSSDASNVKKIKVEASFDQAGAINSVDLNELFIEPDLGSTGAFSLDLTNFIKDGLGYYIQDVGTTGAQPSLPSWGKLDQLTFTEQLEVGGVLVDGASANDGQTTQKWYLNARSAYAANSNLDSFIFDGTTVSLNNGDWLTNSPNNKPIGLGDSEYLGGFTNWNGLPSGTLDFVITKTNKNGSTGVLTSNVKLKVIGSERFDLGVGVANINAISSGFIDSDVASYTVTLWVDYPTTPVIKMPTRTFILDTQCYEKSNRLHWVNPYGAIDSYTFIGENETEIRTESETYEQYRSDITDRKAFERTTLQVDARQRIRVKSDYLTQAQLTWLKEITISPRVWMEVTDGYIPVTIKSDDYVVNTAENLKQMIIDFDYSVAEKTLRS